MKCRFKKTLSLVITIVFLAASTFSSYATTDYFELWGDWDYWTDEQWEESDNWTDEEWDLFYEKQNEVYWQEREAEARERMGLTEPAGKINVRMNDTCIAFDAAKPISKEGSVYVPFRKLFESIGGTVEYIGVTKTAKVTMENKVVEVTVGSEDMVVTSGENKETVKLSNLPFIDSTTASMYIPTRAISEGLGYDVYWDSQYKVVNVIDKESVIAEIDSNLTIVNKILNSSSTDMSKTYKTIYDMGIALTAYGDQKDDVGTIKGNITAISKGFDLSLDGNVKVDVEDFSESFLYGISEELQSILKDIKDVRFSAILNTGEGKAYANVPLLSKYNKTLNENTWIEYEMSEGDFEMIGALSAFMEGKGGSLTIGQVIYAMVWEERDYLYYNTVYGLAKDMAMSYDLLLGDDGFKQSGDQYVMDMDKAAIAQRLVKYLNADEEYYTVDELMAMTAYLSDINYRVVVTVKDDKVTDTEISGAVKIQTRIPLEIAFNGSMNGMQSSVSMDFKGRYIGKVNMTAKSVVEETQEAVKTAPPAGAHIVKYLEYTGYDMMYPDEPTLHTAVG